MTVEEIMTKEIITVTMDDLLLDVKRILIKYKFHHLIVAEEGHLIGVISDRDLLRELSPFIETISEKQRDTDTLNKKVHQVMSRKPISVTKNTKVSKAIDLLLTNSISCLPVVSDENNLLEGIVTWRDILSYYFEQSFIE